jgi:hypothetical protein
MNPGPAPGDFTFFGPEATMSGIGVWRRIRRRAGNVDGKPGVAEFRPQDAGQAVFVLDDQQPYRLASAQPHLLGIA